MQNGIARLVKDWLGITPVEYGAIALTVAVGLVAGVTLLG